MANELTRERLDQVWKAFVDYAEDGDGMDGLKLAAKMLDDFLDELSSEDYFGTEGQCDPRGDARNTRTTPRT